MISTQGLSPMLAVTLVRENRETFENDVRNEAMAKREIAAFEERIGAIGSVEELVQDYEVFSFVMKAFDLEKEIYAKAMMKQIITADPEDKDSILNKLTDSKYKVINETLGFARDGSAGPDLQDPDWQKEMTQRYVSQRLIDSQSSVNESVGTVLAFEQKVSGMSNWYKVLADKEMTDFIFTAFGLPDNLAQADVDSKMKMLSARMDIEDLQDPEMQEKLIRQYSAFVGVGAASQVQSPVLALMSAATNSGTYSVLTVDMEMLRGFSASAYR
ncbi:DUF1217 domain-containing protein [Sulfitobacter aestuarii]|uniref:DUF1217 domain-containing protein n=1 Tax=Sulfitobacter aestuarii TaxID=2161676 RepID=A0ABW5U277_9RHOB